MARPMATMQKVAVMDSDVTDSVSIHTYVSNEWSQLRSHYIPMIARLSSNGRRSLGLVMNHNIPT